MRDRVNKYVPRPNLVCAIQYNGANIDEIREFAGSKLSMFNIKTKTLYVNTQDGMTAVNITDYVCQTILSNVYHVCTSNTFNLIYEFAEEL